MFGPEFQIVASMLEEPSPIEIAWVTNLKQCHNQKKNGKDQSCSKLPEMAKKLIENKFWTF